MCAGVKGRSYHCTQASYSESSRNPKRLVVEAGSESSKGKIEYENGSTEPEVQVVVINQGSGSGG
jgi:hypothetical protein